MQNIEQLTAADISKLRAEARTAATGKSVNRRQVVQKGWTYYTR